MGLVFDINKEKTNKISQGCVSTCYVFEIENSSSGWQTWANISSDNQYSKNIQYLSIFVLRFDGNNIIICLSVSSGVMSRAQITQPQSIPFESHLAFALWLQSFSTCVSSQAQDGPPYHTYLMG